MPNTTRPAKPFALKAVTPTEQQIVNSILDSIASRADIVWYARMNTGAAYGAQFVRFGFPGLSDIIGQLRDGRFFAIEAKRPGQPATQDQQAFLHWVRSNSGIAGIATSSEAAHAILNGDMTHSPATPEITATVPFIKNLSARNAPRLNAWQHRKPRQTKTITRQRP